MRLELLEINGFFRLAECFLTVKQTFEVEVEHLLTSLNFFGHFCTSKLRSHFTSSTSRFNFEFNKLCNMWGPLYFPSNLSL